MDHFAQGEPNYKDIGIRLKEIRGTLSQTAFGNSIGYSYSYVKGCEHGKKQSLEYLFKVSATYDISLEWILRGVAPINTTTQKIEAIFDPDLKRMIDILKDVMASDSPHMRSWAIIQFEKAFADHCAAADEKKRKA